MAAAPPNLSFLSPSSKLVITTLPPPHFPPSKYTRTGSTRFKCSAGQVGFFTRLGRLIKEKAKSDVEKIFSGFSKTRDNLAVIDELLLYWNLSETDRVLDELEEVVVILSVSLCSIFCAKLFLIVFYFFFVV